MTRPPLFVFLALLLLCGRLPSAHAQQYEVVDIGTLGSNCVPAGINASGQIVGTAATGANGDGVMHAFLFSGGSLMDLGAAGGTSSYGKGINNLGQATGYVNGYGPPLAGSNYPSSYQHAFLYDGGVLTDLGAPGGAASATSLGFGINDAGEIVGQAFPTYGYTQAYSWQGGTWTSLGTVAGGLGGIAQSVNKWGLVVGEAYLPNNAAHVFLTGNGAFQDLGSGLSGNSYGVAINDRGDVIGYSASSSYTSPFVIYNGGALKYIPSLTNGSYNGQPTAINNAGQVVGNAHDSFSGLTVPFWYVPGDTWPYSRDLQSGGSRLYPRTAYGINDSGQITGTGWWDGTNANPSRAYLLTPYTPNPAAPATTLTLSGSTLTNGWFPAGATIALSAAAGTSAAVIASTLYRLDGASAQSYTAPFTVSGRGGHSLQFWSTDAAGNAETPHTHPFTVNDFPAITSALPASVPAGSGDTTVTLTGTYFQPGCQVLAGPTDYRGAATTTNPIAVSYVSPTQVQATLPASLLARGGVLNLTVLNPTYGGSSAAFAFNVLNPTPTITSLSPASAPAGGAAFTLTVNGTGFVSSNTQSYPYGNRGSLIAWNGMTQYNTTFVSPTQLTVSIPASALTTAGTAQVTVVNPTPGGGTSNALPFTITDMTPPVTIATVETTGSIGGGWYNSPVNITLAASDASGVANTFYTVDAGPKQTYSAPFAISTDGIHILAYWSVDNVGNVETTNTKTIKIDATPPTLTFGTPMPVANAAGWNNTTVTIPYTASDATSGIFDIYPFPYGYGYVSLGLSGTGQRANVNVVDYAINTATFTSPTVNIDLTAPVTTATVSGETVTLSATDALSGVASTVYSIDGGAQQTYAAPFTVTGVGTHTISFGSTDMAGNVETVHTVSVTVPLTVLSLSLSPTSVKGGAGSSTATITLSGPAPAGGVSILQTSSDTSAATLAPALNIPAGATSAKFKITTYTVSASKSVSITSVLNGSSQTATLTVTPIPLTVTGLSLSPASVPGGTVSTGTVTLSASSKSGVEVMLLSSDTGVAAVPAGVTVPAGKTAATFSFTSQPIAGTKTTTVTATVGTSSQSAILTVTPAITIVSLSFSPTRIKSYTSSTGTITLSGPAPAGGIQVGLDTSDPATVSVAPALHIPAGVTSARFKAWSASVSSTKSVVITATYYFSAKKSTLTITP